MTMSHRAVVLASGGLDSAVTAAIAKQDGCELFFLTMAYGQRHAVEVARAHPKGTLLVSIRLRPC
jgi:7-cyano-7-deazaguanine synthase